MKISLKWLSEYVDVNEYLNEPEKLADKLTHAGIEVEEVIDQRSHFKKIVVGQIEEKTSHPDADRLTVCEVDLGSEKATIVCGAKNHSSGDKVVVAQPGAVLPGDFKIKKSKIRGVASAGMLCSEKELGLSEESAGIMILPPEAEIGQDFASYAGLDDVYFELKVTPNRADCLSHFGLAREIACLLGRELRFPATKINASGSTKKVVELDVRDHELCPRYCGRVVKGVRVGPSPAWLSKRLESVGVNSINNVVDTTNFVMLELGQPLHAFDIKRLKGQKIIVDRSTKQEKFTTLDGTEIELSGNELMIRDQGKPVALAGVVGGLNSGVTEETTDVFIESAYFLPVTVRQTSRKYGIETDSAYRFARGVDPESTYRAMDRAALLIQELAGGEIYGEAYDAYPRPVEKGWIDLSKKRVEEALGYKIGNEEVVEWMKRLGCQVKTSGTEEEQIHHVLPPAFRVDLLYDVDLIEEFARLMGYDRIPETLPPLSQAPSPHTDSFVVHQKCHKVIRAQGFAQAINYAFVSAQEQQEFLGRTAPLQAVGLSFSGPAVPLQNPLSEELDVMRCSLLPGLMANMKSNYRYGNLNGRMYELGSVFFREKEDSFQEPGRLAFIGWGNQVDLWRTEPAPVALEIKSYFEDFLRQFGISSWQWMQDEKLDVPDFLHPGQWAALKVEGKMAGFVGTLHPDIRKKDKLRHDVAVGEFNIDQILSRQPRPLKLHAIPRFPSVERDMTFVLPKEIPVGLVQESIQKQGGQMLTRCWVQDLYEGKPLAEGQRAVTFRVRYQDKAGTLSDKDVDQVQNTLVDKVCRKFSIEVR